MQGNPHTKATIFIIICLTLTHTISATHTSHDLHTSLQLSMAMIDCRQVDYSLVGKGSLDGMYGYSDVWHVYTYLRSEYPRYVSKAFKAGSTVEGKDIKAFYIGEHSKDEDQKNVVLIDALHHAREFITLTMIVQIMVDSVQRLVKCDRDFFKNNRLL